MRNIVNIDFNSNNNWGVMNSASDTNSIMLSIWPLKSQKTNYRIEITRSNNTVVTSSTLTLSGGLNAGAINYQVLYDNFKSSGTMKVRLLSNEGNSPYVLFDSVSTFDINDDIIVKLNGSKFTINKRAVSAEGINIDMIYPIGSVITNSKSTFNPNDLYPGTSWQRIKGRVIVGLDENDEDFNSSGKKGGYKTFNNEHNHNTKGVVLSIEQMPEHTHNIVSTSGKSSDVSLYPFQMIQHDSSIVDLNVCRPTGGNQPHDHGVTEDSQSNNQTLLQPYIVKYVWERIS